jgi:nucleotide-binding universal stress UspA family protein
MTDTKHNSISEAAALQRARAISEQWSSRLDEFDLPCPLCKGHLEFHGVTHERLYEFAEGERGVVEPLEIFPIDFVCNKCGFTAEFDTDLFNPAHLAKLAGAPSERIEELAIKDFRVVVPLRGDERSETMLCLATAIAGQHHGEVAVLDAALNDTHEAMLIEKLQEFKPAVGDPAPVHIIRKGSSPLHDVLPDILKEQGCHLLLLNAKGWTRTEETAIVSSINEVLEDRISDLALIYDRGLPDINRIMLTTGGGPGAKAAAPFARDLALAFDAELHLLYVASPNDANGEDEGQRKISETLEYVEFDEKLKLQRRVVFGDKPTDVVIRESADYDLLLVGGSPSSWRTRRSLDTLSTKIARNSDATAIVVLSSTSTSRSLLSRLLG